MRFGITQNTGEKRPPRNYFARRQQYRLLVLVFSLMLILLLMGEASKPKNWRWLWSHGNGLVASEQQAASGATVDTRLIESEPTIHPPGVFVSPANNAATLMAESEQDKLYPGVDPAELKNILDDTVFRSSEANVWFSWCALMQKADAIASDKLIAQPVGFLQLYRQPDEYRGRLVRIDGIVRRAHRLAAHDNQQGIDGYWRCWLSTDESGTNPIVVYALDMPDDFPTGMEIYEQVAFSGLFFKRWAYEARGGIMTAPLILSPGGDWQRRVPTPLARLPSLLAVLAGLLVTTLVGGAIALFVYRQSNAAGLHRRRLPARASSPSTTNDEKS
jgi:hypothetical protein